MTNIRRYFPDGNLYFVTNVTYERNPLITSNIDTFGKAVKNVQDESPFELIAWAILPDHFHFLIDPKEGDLSSIIKRIKLKFSAAYRSAHGLKRGRIWQYRFWDHIIRNQADLNRHIDYIHYNPVKHGLAARPFLYQHTSFHCYLQNGHYSEDWGMKEHPAKSGDFGE